MTEPSKPAATPQARGAGGRFAARTAAPADPAPTQATSPARDASPAEKVSAARSPLSLLFIRHADAGDSATWEGDDAVRPLSRKGRRQSKRLGGLLDDLGVRPDVLLTSPRVRAADTAKLVGRAVGVKPAVDARLDAGFGRESLAAIVAEVPATASVLVIVGHDPDFSTLASWLADAPISMAKGALVRLELPDRTVGAGSGALRWLLPPDALPR